jgi:serine O-acetyltransferase
MDFSSEIFKKHQTTPVYPASSSVANWANRVILLMYPEQSQVRIDTEDKIQLYLKRLENDLTGFLITMKHPEKEAKQLAERFFNQDLVRIYHFLEMDIDALLQGDPAAINRYEIVRAYPGFYAIAFYRIANALCKMKIQVLPRILTEYAHSRTGIDIHPGAEIGTHFCIDHGTGVVIGETTKIGNYVKVYQGVTLGALSVEKKLSGIKRHPTIEDRVIIYSGATILGGQTVIGANSVIGGNVWLTKSIPACTTVYHKPQIEVKEGAFDC